MKRLLRLMFVVLVLIAASVPVHAQRKNGRVKISNFSKWEIQHIYVALSDSDEWGIDRLRGRILKYSQSVTFQNLPCGIYDVKVENEDEGECVMQELELCNGGPHWRITDQDLAECQASDE